MSGLRVEQYEQWWSDNTGDDGAPLAELGPVVVTLARHVQALRARIDLLPDPGFAPGSNATSCACAYDHPDAVCMQHLIR